VEQRAKEEIRDCEDIKNTISKVNRIHCTFINSLHDENLNGIITLYYYNAPPNLFLIITDAKVLVGFYSREKKGQFFPMIELDIKGRGVTKSFENHFDSLLQDAKVKASSKKAQ
jgi:hypothetical protein